MRRATAIVVGLVLAACGDATGAARPAVATAESPAAASARDPSQRGPAAADAVADVATAAPLVTLIPSDDDAITAGLHDGLTQAFDEARRGGGPDLAIVVAGRAAKWGSAIDGAVEHAVERDALAIVAPPERRHAHLLSQLGTKLRIPVISTSSSYGVIAAGSRYVVSVVPMRSAAGDEAPVAPAFDASSDASAAFVAAFRADRGRDPGAWDAVGYDAGRSVVEAVRAKGLVRRALVPLLTAGAPVRGASGEFAFATNGAAVRESRAGGAR